MKRDSRTQPPTQETQETQEHANTKRGEREPPPSPDIEFPQGSNGIGGER